MKKSIYNLIDRMAQEERSFTAVTFLAPCVSGGQVRTRVAGLIKTFTVAPGNFSGWGIFQATADDKAQLQEEADLPTVAEYLKSFPALRVRLVRPLKGTTWLAYPSNEGDAVRRFGSARPIPVYLVTQGDPFEQALAHRAGGAWWFGDLDRRSDPQHADQLRAALRDVKMPAEIAFVGMTPEMRTVYDLATQADERFEALRLARQSISEPASGQSGAQSSPHVREPRNRDEARLLGALRTGGGDLHSYSDRGEYWVVEWSTRDGSRYTSAVEKGNLGIVSSGICLSGEDHKFDLQSLVPVIERRGPDWEW